MNTPLQLSADGRSVRLCARKTCCPTMTAIDSQTVAITDDEGNTVKMSLEQAKLIGDGINTLQEGKQLLHD